MPNAGLQLRTAEQLAVDAVDGGVGAELPVSTPPNQLVSNSIPETSPISGTFESRPRRA